MKISRLVSHSNLKVKYRYKTPFDQQLHYAWQGLYELSETQNQKNY